ncbi:hypothetical protein NHX12_011597, partial [Muraenolepis orangiensis]
MEEGSVVANLATELGLDVKMLSKRMIRLEVVANRKYLDVNKETGDLYIVERIDREYLCTSKTSTSCFLKLEAIVENPQRIFFIEVEVMDINDNTPHFRRDANYLDISEATQAGERFSVNNAVDPDVGSNSVKTYHLSASEHFDIEIQTGRDGSKFADIILKQELDREKQAVHNLILTAVDGGTPSRTGTASITVRVLDTNDNAPRFDNEHYRVNIIENSPIGSLVLRLNATDLDDGSNAEIAYMYSLYTPEMTQNTFNLNSRTGEITVKGVLNFEDFNIYDMEVIATDKGVPALSWKCNVTVVVEDMNDNHPEISIKSFQSPVKENIEVDSNSCEPLDREKVPEYDITFTVTDRGSPPLSDNETMTLELLDVNDNVPTFPQSFYTIRVMENNAPGALLDSLTAFDPDLHENQYLVYFIIEREIANTSMSMLFSINPENGKLYALKTFDYELEKEFVFHIEARDSGVPPLSSNVTVHIIIVDQNDNTPVIVSPWRAHGSVVEEKIPRSTDKGSMVSKVIAIDGDSVLNSRITYQFLQVTDATLFSLDQYNGEIRTMRMFSYRDPRLQRLVVVAKDNGEPALSATVTIKLSTVETAVKSYSDMSEVPLEYDIFSDLNLYLVIGLGSVSFLLLITILVTIVLKCQKSKSGIAAPPCRNSVLSERNSTIADSTLVSNDAYWYSLFLAETRKGKLVVRQPAPKGSRYIVSSLPRSTGLTMTSDSAPSTLQYLVYFIIEREIANTSMSMLFSINPENGKLYALKTFDYELEKEFVFHIEARDSGVPPLSSNVTVHIIIVDQNDNTPVIVSPWRAHGSVVEEKIPRSTDKGSMVSKVIAIDGDSVLNSRITYQFLQVTDATLFSLDQYNGEIRTMRMFSYRDPRLQRLVVVAKDNGEPALSATVTIKLSTVETAVKSYSDMSEVPLEYDIFSDLNLYLVIGLGSVSFLLLITILVTIVLKCQKSKSGIAAPPCRNSVLSERNSTIADSTLVSNDAYWYSLFLAETRKGKLVVRQPAPKGSRYIVSSLPRSTGLTMTSDSAPSTLQYLVYFIIEREIANTSMSMLFSINPENGKLYALKTFDYELEKEFVFHIEARDSGVPPLSSNVTVHIIIVDQNDNAPVIVSPWRAHGSVVEEKIPRSTDKGSMVSKVIAIDGDSVLNSRITYQFLQVTDATLFSLDQYNGEIRTMRMFSYRDPRLQRLVVVAKDNGEPALSATVTIKLSTVETAVKSYSDMSEVPLEYDIFSDLNLYLVIGLGSVSFLLLITILVTIVLKCQKSKSGIAAPPCRNSVLSERNSTIADSTLVSNDAYWYSLFLAETRKGKLVVRQPAPKGSRYIVSSLPRSTGLTMTSDSAPSTLQYLVYFIIEREIANTSMSMLFSINPENGKLYALKTFDYELEKEFVFHIEARDSGVPPLSSNVTVHIIIVDQNDNTPVIVSPWRAHGSVVEEKIPRSTDKGSMVSKVIAIDGDSVLNSRITYQFLQVTDATLFSLDQYNGEIRTMRMFSYRDPRLQRLVVVAKDNGEPALSATVTIKLSTVETAVKSYSDMSEVPLEYDIFSDLNLYLVIGLGSVSFLLLITILVTIVLKCQKSKSGIAAPPCRNSVLSERNSTIADSTLVSNDAYWYSLFLAETRKGKLVVRQPAPKGSRYIVSSLPRSTGLTMTSDSAPSTLQSAWMDLHENQYLVYFIIEREIANTSMSMLFSINPENGKLYALKTFDYELEKEFVFHIEARDSGVPPLSSNVTVHIIIVDQNDNTPVIVSPWRAHGSVVEEKIPRSTDKGSMVSKVIAIDGDSVLNSRITYQFLQVTDATLFSLDQYNGEIRTMRMFSYRDPRLQRLVVVAKDNGEPALSATVTIKLSTVETAVKSYSDMSEVPLEYDIFSDLNLYLVIGLGSVSFLLLITIFVTIVLKCQKSKSGIAAPLCRNSVLSERNSTIADSTLVSNDAYWYSLFLAETRKGKLVVRQPAPKGSRYIVSSLPRSTGLTMTSDSAPSTLQSGRDGSKFADLMLKTTLDREQQAVHNLVLTAFDGGAPTRSENGKLYALKTFDYELEKEFVFHIEARDSGVPPLSSNVTVHIIIVDQNDNTPVIVSPWRAHGSVVEEKIPRSTDKGSLVSKVIAIDGDSVLNSRITYQFLQVTDATLFSLDQYNGEIRTMRMFSYRDPRLQRLVVVAKDNGEPALSATVTIKLSTVETAVKSYSDMSEVPLEYDIFSDLNLYLVIGLGSVSFLLLITILVTIVLKCQKSKSGIAAPPCRNSVLSERNSTIADSTLVSNDAYWYSLFLAETRKGKLVVRQPAPKGSRYIVSSLPRSTGLTMTSDSAPSTLQALDREAQAVHRLVLTAVDGGVPARSGTANIVVRVLDVNDNAPSFDKDNYTI